MYVDIALARYSCPASRCRSETKSEGSCATCCGCHASQKKLTRTGIWSTLIFSRRRCSTGEGMSTGSETICRICNAPFHCSIRPSISQSNQQLRPRCGGFLANPGRTSACARAQTPIPRFPAHPATQCLARAAKLRRDRRDDSPLRVVVALMFQNHSHSPLTNFRRVPWGLLLGVFHSSIFSRSGASGNPGNW
ncbi:hypothetical protein QF000_000527 [Paraburkholderia atlantica]